MVAGLKGVLVGMGNPLLDISAVVDQEFMDKYGVSFCLLLPRTFCSIFMFIANRLRILPD